MNQQKDQQCISSHLKKILEEATHIWADEAQGSSRAGDTPLANRSSSFRWDSHISVRARLRVGMEQVGSEVEPATWGVGELVLLPVLAGESGAISWLASLWTWWVTPTGIGKEMYRTLNTNIIWWSLV